MAKIFPSLENIERLTVEPTPGEKALLQKLQDLSDEYEVFFNPYLDGDRPDFIILRKNYGAFIIEVKDWNLDAYYINKFNKWSVIRDRKGNEIDHAIKSPMSQVFKYKQHLYELHLPLLGYENLFNPAFYKVITGFVYFHGVDKTTIGQLYEKALKQNRESITEESRKNTSSKKLNFLDQAKRGLNRDRTMALVLDNIIKKIAEYKNFPESLFTEKIYDEFKRVLLPPLSVENQGIPITFDKFQKAQVTSIANVKVKIKGVAGSGKTSVLAERAVSAMQRLGSDVLILTFNLTLKNLLRDAIKKAIRSRNIKESDLNGSYEITNYHTFYKSQLNNLGIGFPKLFPALDEDEGGINDEIVIESIMEAEQKANSEIEKRLDQIFKTDLFRNKDISKYSYSSIFIDEIQDYEPEWMEIVINNFLKEDGEVVIFGDNNQNIYNRQINQKDFPVTKGFGHWKNFKLSHRTQSPDYIEFLNGFQDRFLLHYDDNLKFEVPSRSLSLGFSYKKYHSLIMNDNVFNKIQKNILTVIRNLTIPPNDIVVLASTVEVLRPLMNSFHNAGYPEWDITFETQEEWDRINKQFLNLSEKQLKSKSELIKKLAKETDSLREYGWRGQINQYDKFIKEYEQDKIKSIYSIRRHKKTHFNANSGKMKCSTSHSFKGFESSTVFLIILPTDTPEVIYTGLTRVINNVIVYDFSNGEISNYIRDNINN